MSKYKTEGESLSTAQGQTPTGEDVDNSRIIVYPFAHYQVFVRVSSEGKFLDIVELRVDKEFLSYKQKIESRGYHDVDDLYEK